jgi:hypothetical protein
LFVTGDRLSFTCGVLIHFDNFFLASYEKCIDDIYESALKWAYEAECEEAMPFMKHFYLWKEMTKEENLPLPPCERILPMQDAFWNGTK